jgi:hypothetical protein
MIIRTASWDKPELAPSEQRRFIPADSRAAHGPEKTRGHLHLSGWQVDRLRGSFVCQKGKAS